jgi:hypothetical protein
MSRDRSVQPYSSRLRHRVQEFLPSAWLAVILIVPAHADDARDFSALYDLGSARQVDPTHVAVQLYLSLQNHGAIGVRNSTIFLVQPNLVVEIGSAPVADGVTVAHRAVASISGTLTIDAVEYQRWQRGQWSPLLYIRFTDAQGHQIDQRVELARRPGLGARP